MEKDQGFVSGFLAGGVLFSWHFSEGMLAKEDILCENTLLI